MQITVTREVYDKVIKIHSVWYHMHNRCENERATDYHKYGGRGIAVCEEWDDPMAFFEWALANGHEHSLQLDRIDNDGPYAPWNCRFATASQNCRNRGNTKVVTIDGKTLPVAEWAELLGLSYITLYKRIKLGQGNDDLKRPYRKERDEVRERKSILAKAQPRNGRYFITCPGADEARKRR